MAVKIYIRNLILNLFYDPVADFRLKFLCMGLAALNMLLFQYVTSQDVEKWDKGQAPIAGKVAGAVSLLLWIGVIYFARMTGFTLVQGGA